MSIPTEKPKAKQDSVALVGCFGVFWVMMISYAVFPSGLSGILFISSLLFVLPLYLSKDWTKEIPEFERINTLPEEERAAIYHEMSPERQGAFKMFCEKNKLPGFAPSYLLFGLTLVAALVSLHLPQIPEVTEVSTPRVTYNPDYYRTNEDLSQGIGAFLYEDTIEFIESQYPGYEMPNLDSFLLTFEETSYKKFRVRPTIYQGAHSKQIEVLIDWPDKTLYFRLN